MKPLSKLERRIVAHRVNLFIQEDSASRRMFVNYPDAADEFRYYEMYILYIDIIGLSNETPD